jgi:hypothetical protein
LRAEYFPVRTIHITRTAYFNVHLHITLANGFFYTTVYQTVVRGPRVVRDGLSGGFGRKIATIVSETERMKNTPKHVCAKTTFVGWPQSKSTRISSFLNFFSFSH